MTNRKVKFIEPLQAGVDELTPNRTTNKYIPSRALKSFQTEHRRFMKQ